MGGVPRWFFNRSAFVLAVVIGVSGVGCSPKPEPQQTPPPPATGPSEPPAPKAPISGPETRPVISEEVATLEAIAPVAKDGHKGVGFLRKPPGKGPFPVVVLLQGGGGGFSSEQIKNTVLDTWASRYLAAGYVIATVSYRERFLIGDPQSSDALEDVLALIERLRKLPYVDPNRIVLNGCSGGGDLSLSVATATDLTAIVLEEPAAFIFAGIYNKEFRKMDVNPLKTSELIRANPKKYYTPESQKLTGEKMARIKCPILIIQGDRPKITETITGINQFNSEITIPELRAAGKTLEVKTYPGERHCFAFGEPHIRTPTAAAYQAFEDVTAFLQKHLRTKPSPMDPSLVKQVPFAAK